jgi:hypothetical protein
VEKSIWPRWILQPDFIPIVYPIGSGHRLDLLISLMVQFQIDSKYLL